MRNVAIALLTFSLMTKAHAGALDTWTNVGSTTHGSFGQVIYAGGAFAAISKNPNLPFPQIQPNPGGVSFSHDGIHWTTYGLSQTPSGIAYGNGRFVVSEIYPSGGADSGALQSFDTNFTVGSFDPGVSPVTGITFANGEFVASAYFYEEGQGVAYTSTDGTNWATSSIGTNFYPTGIASDGFAILAVGGQNLQLTSNQVFYSTDGTTWEDITTELVATNVTGRYLGINVVNDSFYTQVLSNTTTVDYRDWEPFAGPIPTIWLPTTGTNSMYVTLGGTNVYTSKDATNWVTHPTGLTNILTSIAYGGGYFVAVSADGSIFLSGSATPSLAAQNQSPGVIQLTITGGLGPTYRVLASTNLSGWTNLATLTNFGPSIQYVDTNAGNFAQRYYRTVSP